MADIESNIDININSAQALSAIKQLQAQLSGFYQDLSKLSSKGAAEAANLQNKLVNSINSTGKFAASVRNVATTTESFTDALERNKLGMGEYFRFAGSQVTGFRKLFSTEFDTIDKVARERVKTLQTQYIKLGRDANGAMKSIAVRPLSLDMDDLGTKVAMTAQKQQIFNQLLKQGSTDLLNFGKNTQWAGRQLMVGFTIPLSIFGATAAREFMKLEEQTIRFQKVYGDFATSAESTDKMTESIKNLGIEFTKYGVAVEKTIGLAADAAAMGKTGAELTAQVAEATRLAVLGGVDQQQSLETTISLTNAFGIASDKLAGKVNFLNAVENQTVTSIEDLTIAIPKAGPVIQQLGGDVEDLAFFMTAMKEGGIDAGEGANALKSGLASMINPTQEASDMLAGFGINLKGIVEANKGDIKGTVVGFAEALNQLDPLNRAQAIEQLFGKFQFARISTLFQNVTDQASQANRVLQLTTATQEELAVLSEREMKRMEKSPMYQFQGAVERFQAALAPIGESFLKAVTPIIDFGTEILNKFNEMGDGAKQFWTILVAAVGGLGPVLLMTFGLLANGVANIIKMFTAMGGLFGKLSGQSKLLGGSTQYMTQEQLESAAVAASLNQVHQNLIQTFTSEASAAYKLAAAYQTASAAARAIVTPMIGGGAGQTPKKYADGVFSVPGPKGAGDIVPAMLAPGEAVIPTDKAEKYRGLIQGIIAGNIPGFMTGTIGMGVPTGSQSGSAEERRLRYQASHTADMSPDNLIGTLLELDDEIKDLPVVIDKMTRNLETGALEIERFVGTFGEAIERGFVDPSNKAMMGGAAYGASAVMLPADANQFLNIMAKKGGDNAELFSGGAATLDDLFEQRRVASTQLQETPDMAWASGGQKLIAEADAWSQKLADSSDTLSVHTEYIRESSKNAIANALQQNYGMTVSESLAEAEARLAQADLRLAQARERGATDEEVISGYLKDTQVARVRSTTAKRDDRLYITTGTDDVQSDPVRANIAGKGFASGHETPERIGGFDDVTARPPAGTRKPRELSLRLATWHDEVRDDIIDAVDEAGKMASPSERIDDSGENLVAGLEQGIESGADDIKAAGQKVIAGIDPEKAAQIRAETRAAEAASDKALGVSIGPAPVQPTTPKKKKLVTGEDVLSESDVRAAAAQQVINEMKAAGETPATNKMAAGIDAGIAKLKEKFPKYAGLIDDKVGALQKSLDLDGSFAAQEEQQRQLMIQAEQKYAEALSARAAAIAAGQMGVPDVTPESVFGPGPELDAWNARKDQQNKDVEKEAKRQKRAKRASAAFGVGMAASTALGVMSMTGGPMAEFAQGAMPVAGALTTVLPMIMALPGPLAAVAAGLAVIAGGAILFNNMLNDAREKGVKFAESLGMGRKAMDEFAEFAGKASSREIGDKIRERQTSAFAFQSNEKTFGQSYVESEGGKARLKSLEEALKMGTSEDAGRKLGLQLSAAVADNLMTPEQARSIAVNLGEQLDNQELLSNAVVQINKVVGPNGENALESGIDLKVNLLQEANASLLEGQKQAQDLADARQKKRDAVQARYEKAGVTGDSLGQWQAAIDGMGQDFANMFAPAAEAATAAGILATNIAQAVELTQQLVDSTDIYWSKLRDAAIAQGDLNKASEYEQIRLQEKNRLLTEQNDIYKTLEAQVLQSQKGNPGGFTFFGINDPARVSRDQTWETQRKSIESKLGAEGINAANAIKDQANETATTGITEVRQVQLLAAMDAGTLDPSVAMEIVNIYASDEDMMTKVMSIITEMDPESANRVLALSKVFETEEAKKTFITRFEGATLDEQERYLEAYTFINKIAQAGDKELKVIMDFYNAEENIDLLEEVQKDLQVIEDTPDPQLNIELIGSVSGVDPAMLQGYSAWFEGLPPEQKRAFTSVFTSIYQQIGSKDENVDYQDYLKENHLKDTDANFAKYAGDTAKALTPTLTDITAATPEPVETPVTPSGGGGGGRESSVLDDILQKLRRVQMSTLALTEGWKGAREALDGLFPGGASNSPFQGIEQQMRRLGAKEDLITMIAGMDPEEFQKRKEELFTFDGAGNIVGFRDSLLSIGAALRSIKFGEFQSEQQKNVNVIRDQNEAIRKLIANGFSMADAYEMVQDAAFASAVAQEGNNEVIKQATEDYKKATEQAKLFAAAQAAVTANKEVTATEGALAFIANNAGNLSNEVINEILTNPDFAKLIMSPTLTQEQKDALQQWIDNIENATQLELDVKLQTIEGMEDVFQDGFSKAMEAFSAQEKRIELEFEVKKDPFQKTVENAQNLIADIQNRPGGMDDLQADLDRIAYKEEDINKRYQERVDRLQEIKRNNDKILQQKKAELTVADAITQGDIAAAAKAIEDARAQQMQSNMQAQQEMLQRQKEAELAALTGQMGLTREQIDMRIRDLRQEILNIEETMLEPAQYQLSLLERQEKRQKESLTVLGMTRREWETIKNRIDVARTSSDDYKKAMEAARDVVGKIVEYWTEIQKPKTTVHTIVTVYETQGSPSSPSGPASGDPSGGNSGGGNSSTTTPSSSATSPSGAWDANMNSRTSSTLKYRMTQAMRNVKNEARLNSLISNWRNYQSALGGNSADRIDRAALTMSNILKSVGYNAGGLVSGYGSGDKIRAMLTPGEFVITKPAVDAYGARMMKDINNGTFQSGSVYNYSISVNVETDANADQIANTVMRKIKSIDAMRIQGNRF